MNLLILQRDLIMELQKRMTQIISFAMPTTLSNNPLFFVKYDGEKAWYAELWPFDIKAQKLTQYHMSL